MSQKQLVHFNMCNVQCTYTQTHSTHLHFKQPTGIERIKCISISLANRKCKHLKWSKATPAVVRGSYYGAMDTNAEDMIFKRNLKPISS